MAYDLQEQEQIDSMKAFWQQWGKLISGAVVAISVAYLGYKAFGYYQSAQASKAAVVFADVEQAAQSQDLAKVKSSAGLLQSDYSSTAYAADAALLAAKVAFEKNDLATAQAQLSWVVQNVKDESMVAVAHLRLATIELDQKRYDAAIAELGQAHPSAFDALFLDQKGDVHAAKGDKAAARDAYKAALAKLVGESPNRQFIQTKLDALGG
ncbi:YfgM family protein [Aquitalea aquatica]|uniref:Ancillary SecYEG translocon subunit n=1 Tax=Aquitalea aquatica TaxID=3044273 RepID=A0A838XY93_9NEIS|nr:tetratricopeptide repeat protein [Aquitalea magnusonii]MBA4707653.1 tetratricopeptide repeat protein [Aquitalea magnusonii]